ncbi:MAG TPA: 23S rRNA (adenine(2503)-C(2))-methyltransferase RlmN, partial [Rhizomicrobium sp.]|nr:23S rRNA (adenine(2503)-C(2))-methyltransferase RlmN [Rhizomicrobium sp.]
MSTSENNRTSLIGLDREGLKTALVAAGVSPKSVAMRVNQLWNWIYVHGARDFASMSNLAKDFRALLENSFTLERPQIVTAQVSEDGTRKWLLKTGAGIEFETVYIPEEGRGTLCVSSQVGCTLNCRFCHTGTQKLVRNLLPSEILGQLLIAKDALEDWPGAAARRSAAEPSGRATNKQVAPGRKVTNIVMMGMGEPLYNFDNVKAALAIVMDGDALELSKRRG